MLCRMVSAEQHLLGGSESKVRVQRMFQPKYLSFSMSTRLNIAAITARPLSQHAQHLPPVAAAAGCYPSVRPCVLARVHPQHQTTAHWPSNTG